jgi:O-antigen/teichoic acid export membrane protein
MLSTALAIAIGLRVSGSTGLLVAYACSQAAALLASVWLLRTSSTLRACPPIDRLCATLKRHRQFAVYGLPTNFIERWAEQLPILAFAQIGAADSSGSFNRARMLVTSPITLAISSVSSVYQERASKIFHKTGSCQDEAKQTTILLALIGLPVLVIGMAFCRPFIDLFLGANWSSAGTFALILAPMLYVRAVVAPISTAYGFARQQKLDLFVTGLPVGLSSAAFLILILTEQPPIAAVYLYSASYTLVHAIQGIGAFRISGGSAS